MAQVSIIEQQKFAKGGDFITNGPQSIMVGDNPGGQERVQVTPLSSPNYNGPQSSTRSESHHYDLSISISGNADSTTLRGIRQAQHNQVLMIKRTLQSSRRLQQTV
jgi:hypothetical protein